MWYNVVAMSEEHTPLADVAIQAISLTAWPTVSAIVETDNTGMAEFLNLTGPHYFKPQARRFSGGIRDRVYTGKVYVQVVAIGPGGINYDYVVDPNGAGDHLTLQAALDACLEDGKRAIWVCTTSETLAEDISIIEDAAKPGYGEPYLIHTAPWSDLQLTQAGISPLNPHRVTLVPATNDTPALDINASVHFQGFLIDNDSLTSDNAELISIRGARVTAAFEDCDIRQRNTGAWPVFSTAYGGVASCNTLWLKRAHIRHYGDGPITKSQAGTPRFNITSGVILEEVSARGYWDGIHACRFLTSYCFLIVNNDTYAVIDWQAGIVGGHFANSYFRNQGNGGCIVPNSGYTCDDIKIGNCEFVGNGSGIGVRLAWGDRLVVTGSTFYNFTSGVEIAGMVAMGDQTRGVAVTGNVFHTCATGINDGGNLTASELAGIVTVPNAYYNCGTNNDFWGAPGGGGAGPVITDADADTYITTEAIADEDVIHIYVDGTEQIQITSTTLLIDNIDQLTATGLCIVQGASKLAFFGETPIVRTAAYTITNRVDDRTIDCDATALDELADVLATVIYDLQQYGLLQ